LLGIVTLALSLIVLGLLPLFSSPEVRSMNFRPISRIIFFCFSFVCVLLTFIGGRSVQYPYVLIGQISTFLYFSFFILVLPFLENVELALARFILSDKNK